MTYEETRLLKKMLVRAGIHGCFYKRKIGSEEDSNMGRYGVAIKKQMTLSEFDNKFDISYNFGFVRELLPEKHLGMVAINKYKLKSFFW